ncbi:hypothetical protein FB561_2496 [Kribbella amoyensis]|uniref:Uncharacterized protein n=1 Tax=Kribbella amoyensis TaxID=996641 RepID=A0A561BRJ8_9ACTN|nr:hypothetical protein [Kribbella amoyensis]TWD81383.1 hypothetical protein FB561_2496 [Kribbella amoyensis]
MGFFERGIAVTAASAAVIGLCQSTASASVQWTNDTFDVCAPFPYDYSPSAGFPCTNRSYGGIVWGNRTARIQGAVTDDWRLNSSTVVYFDAFAGSTKVEGTVRRSEGNSVSFNFYIGDPDLVGGIDRIRIQVCHYRPPTDPIGKCSTQYNEIRD